MTLERVTSAQEKRDNFRPHKPLNNIPLPSCSSSTSYFDFPLLGLCAHKYVLLPLIMFLPSRTSPAYTVDNYFLLFGLLLLLLLLELSGTRGELHFIMWPSVKKKKKKKKNKEEGGYRQDDEKERPTALRWQQSKGNATDTTRSAAEKWKREIVLRRPETLAAPLCREFEPDGGGERRRLFKCCDDGRREIFSRGKKKKKVVTSWEVQPSVRQQPKWI